MRIGKKERRILQYLLTRKVAITTEIEIRQGINSNVNVYSELNNLIKKKLVRKITIPKIVGYSRKVFSYIITNEGVEIMRSTNNNYDETIINNIMKKNSLTRSDAESVVEILKKYNIAYDTISIIRYHPQADINHIDLVIQQAQGEYAIFESENDMIEYVAQNYVLDEIDSMGIMEFSQHWKSLINIEDMIDELMESAEEMWTEDHQYWEEAKGNYKKMIEKDPFVEAEKHLQGYDSSQQNDFYSSFLDKDKIRSFAKRTFLDNDSYMEMKNEKIGSKYVLKK